MYQAQLTNPQALLGGLLFLEEKIWRGREKERWERKLGEEREGFC
jgi:hypothetical protein